MKIKSKSFLRIKSFSLLFGLLSYECEYGHTVFYDAKYSLRVLWIFYIEWSARDNHPVRD